MNRDRRTRITAAVATALICAAVVALLLVLALHYELDEPRVWPPEDTSELLLDGEYVMTGDIAEPARDSAEPAEAAASEAIPEAADLRDSGEAADDPAPTVTQQQESPAQEREKPRPERTGPTKEEREQAEREKKQREQKESISRRVKFGSAARNSVGEGKSGSPDGNSTTGALSGKPGTNLRGRTLEAWQRPQGTATGTITVTVRVNRQGRVVGASYASGTGPVASVASARRSCEQAALSSQFSVSLDAPAEQTGTITYRFE